MSLCCIYHATLPMQVMEEEAAEQYVTSGEWFKHPNLVKGITYEEPIRQRSRKRSKHGKNPTNEI
jgi:hypothetical protein